MQIQMDTVFQYIVKKDLCGFEYYQPSLFFLNSLVQQLDDLPLKDEKWLYRQTSTGQVLKARLRKLPRDGVELIWAFPRAQIPS